MDSEFWIKAWEEGRTNFNQKSYNEKLLQYFPDLHPQKYNSVLVPLCGKSVDMVWLRDQGLKVHGIELYESAVSEFFSEHDLKPEISSDSHFKNFSSQDILISCGDFFKLDESRVYDFVYDRAALVALPQSMRQDYVKVITRSIKSGGECLLLVYEYDQTKLEGPPFSISEKEVHELYGNAFSIKLVDNQRPTKEGARLSETISLTQKVYILQKKAN